MAAPRDYKSPSETPKKVAYTELLVTPVKPWLQEDLVDPNLDEYTEIKSPKIGGSSHLTTRERKSSVVGQPDTVWYVTVKDAYTRCAYDILRYLEINAPRALIGGPELVGTQKLEGYIPIGTIRHDVDLQSFLSHVSDEKDKETCIKLRSQYQFDFRRQVIIDLQDNNREYKITGCPFSMVPALVLGDTDWQPFGSNCGFVKKGERSTGRFYFSAIDKFKVDFTRFTSFHEMIRHISDTTNEDTHVESKEKKQHMDFLSDPIFREIQVDQEFHFIWMLQQALKEEKGESILDEIFLNPGFFSKGVKLDIGDFNAYKANFAKNIAVIIEEYEKNYGKDFLKQFEKREKERNAIVDKVIEKMAIPSSIATRDYLTALKKNLMHDLRAPHYNHLLNKPDKLIQVMFFDATLENCPRNAILALQTIFKERLAVYKTKTSSSKRAKIEFLEKEMLNAHHEITETNAHEKLVSLFKLIKNLSEVSQKEHRSQIITKKAKSELSLHLDDLLNDLNAENVIKWFAPKTPLSSAEVSTPSTFYTSSSETSTRRPTSGSESSTRNSTSSTSESSTGSFTSGPSESSTPSSSPTATKGSVSPTESSALLAKGLFSTGSASSKPKEATPISTHEEKPAP